MENREQGIVNSSSSVEAMLRESQEQNKKLIKTQRIMSVIMICLLLFIGISVLYFNIRIATATEDLPELITNTNEAVKEISKVDFEGINRSISNLENGLNTVDFAALNESIENLQQASEGFSRIMSIFNR